MVLAAKAATFARRPRCPRVLHGVAYRTALRARTMADRRRRRETRSRALPEPAAANAADRTPTLAAMLDEEIGAAPGAYRAPVVLCELEGLCRKDAARRLGITGRDALQPARGGPQGARRSAAATGRGAVGARASRPCWPGRGECTRRSRGGEGRGRDAPGLVPAAVAALSPECYESCSLDKLKVAALLAGARVGLLACAALARSRPQPAPPRRPAKLAGS